VSYLPIRWGRLVWVASGLALACSEESAHAPPSELRQSLTQEMAAWTPLAISTTASSRAFHGAVYDPVLESILVFGGRHAADAGASVGDSGLVSGPVWAALSSPYARRGYVSGVWDAERARSVTYGGVDVGLLSGVSRFAETWEFDGASRTWALTNSASLPGRRSSYGLAYDSRRKVTVLFGGFDRLLKDDLYEWDGAVWTRACATEPCRSGPRPSARALSVFVYDEARGVSLLFGGSGATGLLGDTWSWDGVRWTLLEPAVSPEPRDSGAATYDPVSQRVLLFGGALADAREAADFWVWNGGEWSPIAQTTTPLNRRGAGLVWDAGRRRGVLLGGTAEGEVTDAWTFVLRGSPCKRTEQCHVGACVQGTCSSPVVDGGATGAGGDTDEGGTTGGLSGGSTGGTSGVVTPGASTGGSALGGGPPTTEGNEPDDAQGPGGFSGGTTSVPSDRGGSAGESALGAGKPPELQPNDPDATAVSRGQSFYACGVGRSHRASYPLTLLAPLLLLALKRARRRGERSGPTAPHR
jgi:hypothetical protein